MVDGNAAGIFEIDDVVLMRSDPLDVVTALHIGRATLRKMRQNLGWAIGYNAIALPIAAGVFEPGFGLMLRPEITALNMSGSSVIVAVSAAGRPGQARAAGGHTYPPPSLISNRRLLRLRPTRRPSPKRRRARR